MSKEDDFFNGFEPKTLKVDPIGPTAALQARIRELEQERDELSRESAEWSSAALSYQAQIKSLNLELDQRSHFMQHGKEEIRDLQAQLQAVTKERDQMNQKLKQAGSHSCGCDEWPECTHTLAAYEMFRDVSTLHVADKAAKP